MFHLFDLKYDGTFGSLNVSVVNCNLSKDITVPYSGIGILINYLQCTSLVLVDVK